MIPIQQGQYFYLTVLGQLPPDDYVQELLEAFPPPSVTSRRDRDWLNNAASRRQAIVQAGLWVRRSMGNKTRLRRQYPQDYVSARNQQGRPIGVVSNSGNAIIRWLRGDGKQIFIRVFCKMAIPTSHYET